MARLTLYARIKGKVEELHPIFHFPCLILTNFPLIKKTQWLFITNNDEGHNCNGLV